MHPTQRVNYERQQADSECLVALMVLGICVLRMPVVYVVSGCLLHHKCAAG